jgi:serine/threonine protein kinase, bacterial
VMDVMAIVDAIADALDFAHQRGLLHRDVKPANILMTVGAPQRRILLADFGIGREIAHSSGLTATNMTVGTVSYAVPEQLMGDSLDGRADQYALGAPLYHLLTGHPVFDHSNPAVVISRHLNAAPPLLSDRRSELAALLTLDLRNIANALVDGTRLVVGSSVDGGHDIVDGIVATQTTIATALAAQPPATATALSGKIASAKVTDVPKLSRKTATLTLSSLKDRTDTSGTTKKADETSSSPTETPKGNDDNAQTAKGDTSATADKPDRPRLKSFKKDAENSNASSKRETKKADRESESAGANDKQAPYSAPTRLGFTARRQRCRRGPA